MNLKVGRLDTRLSLDVEEKGLLRRKAENWESLLSWAIIIPFGRAETLC
jgi:hypothetical protein